MKAVILAAGLGNRLGNLTEDRPKAMVKVEGRELILRAMDFLDAADFSERIVITGYQADTLSAFLKEHCPKVTVLHNPDYKRGSVKTIETALTHLNEDFLLMNVDHIYPRRMLTDIMNNRRGLMAICDFDRQLEADDMKIRLDGDYRLSAISKTLGTYKGGYIGMTWCGKEMLSTYRDAIRATISEEGDDANVEAILAHLAKNKAPIEVFDASGIGWLEVDTQEDLHRAENTLKNNMDFFYE